MVWVPDVDTSHSPQATPAARVPVGKGNMCPLGGTRPQNSGESYQPLILENPSPVWFLLFGLERGHAGIEAQAYARQVLYH